MVSFISHRLNSHETNRLIEGTKQNIATTGCIGGEVTITKDAPFLKERDELFNKFYEEYQKTIAGTFDWSSSVQSFNVV